MKLPLTLLLVIPIFVYAHPCVNKIDEPIVKKIIPKTLTSNERIKKALKLHKPKTNACRY